MDLEFLFGAAVGTAITGAVFEKLEKVKLFCTQCGKEVQSGASFCCYCGAKVQGTAKGIESMYREAMDYYREGKYRKAISILEKLIEFGRSDSMIYLALWYSWSKLATSQRDNKRIFLSATDKVVKYHKVILRLHRQGISIPADMLEEVKKITKACQTYKDVLTGKLQVQSNEGAKYEHKADLAMKAGDPKKALQWINKAIEAETNDVWVKKRSE
jgi:tetratricopeptide (TPR) repeat protein